MAEMMHKLKQKIESFASQDKESLSKLDETLKIYREIAQNSDECWIGQWSNPNFDHYKNFIKDDGYQTVKLSLDLLKKYADIKADSKLDEIQEQLKSITEKYREYKEEIITELSIYRGKEEFLQEENLLDKIEKFEWIMPVHDYVQLQKPKFIFTYSPEELLNKGIEIPPHVSFSGEVLALSSNIISINQFTKLVKRILRQLELKNESKSSSKLISNLENLYHIINKFHVFAVQLRNRYDKRDTFLVKDEYDVQDLFHALLKIHFEDVRPEEYTPSYAGSSTRMDFLLKNEQVIIEIKKTRDNLKDRDVGDQLILDIAHYKAHPDCKRLICFVYDPDSKIRNPRGLENDLNELSSENLIVETFIKP